mgnify:CR=1 FL=1
MGFGIPFVPAPIFLLIAPEGIEISFNFLDYLAYLNLLIAPEGIEIP